MSDLDFEKDKLPVLDVFEETPVKITKKSNSKSSKSNNTSDMMHSSEFRIPLHQVKEEADLEDISHSNEANSQKRSGEQSNQYSMQHS